MNKQPLLLTAVSVMSFFSASQALASHKEALPVLADPSDTFVAMAAAGNPVKEAEIASDLTLPEIAKYHKNHVNIQLEGIQGRNNQFASIVHVANATNDSTPLYTETDPFTIPQKHTTGMGVVIGYTFNNQWDLTVSYRYWNETYAPSASPKTYYSTEQLIANSSTTPYVSSITSTNGNGATSFVTSIGLGTANSNAAYTVETSAEQITEASELTYHGGNIDAGHVFTFHHGFSIRPYVGVAYRHIGYKDTTTFSTVGSSTGGATSTNDYIKTGAYAIGENIELNSDNDAYEWRGGSTMIVSGSAVTVENTATTSGQDDYSTNSNEAYITAAGAYYIGDNLPSYTSKFNGVGPRFGMDAQYAWGKYVALTAGLEFSLPYATLKTSGVTASFSTENIQSSGQSETDTTTTNSLLTNRNLRLVGDASTSYSYSTSKVVPEAQFNFGVRISNDVTEAERMTCQFELGYRFVQDWGALKNVDFKSGTGSTATSALGAYNTGSSYKSVTNYGPYLRFGVGFGS